MGNWVPTNVSFESLVIDPSESENISQPYPFYLAYALDISFEDLGEPDDWQIERKWDEARLNCGELIVPVSNFAFALFF